MKRKLLSLVLALTMILSAFAGVITISAAEPTATVATPAVIEMLEGAAIRCADPSGIRFISKISTANAEAATEMGTYIFPYDKYEESGASTPLLYFAYADEKAKADTSINVNNYYVKILANEGIHTDGEDTYLYAALVNIQEKNYGRDFAAVSYAVINGVTHYSEFNTFKNVRNIREVAAKAYNDFSAIENAKIDGYTYKYQVAEGKWSCYSPEQREVIAKYDNAMFRLTIGNDGSVWNGAANGPTIEDYDKGDAEDAKYNVNSDKVVNATDKTVSFTGTKHQSGTYNIPVNSFESNMSNGFSFEITVKITKEDQIPSGSSYVGIFDYEEYGGWGLMLKNATANDGKVELLAELAHGTSNATRQWVSVTKSIDLNEWYHCVFSYDGSSLKFYVNGELAGTRATANPLVLASFDMDSGASSRTDQEYICIGACLQEWSGQSGTGVGDFGFTGNIGTCNLFADPVTESEVTSMYGDYQRTESVWLNDLLTTKHQLRADADGNFNVLVLSDVQFDTSNIHQETLNNIKTIVDREQPDLVIFNGDNCFNIRNAEYLKAYVTNMTAYLEEKQIPWAHVYGNHDAENNAWWKGSTGNEGDRPLTREEQQAVFESFEYCVSESGMADVYGVGNYVLPVFSHDGSEILYNVWCMDSGTSFGVWGDCEVYSAAKHGEDKTKKHAVIKTADGDNTVFGHYEPMKHNQVDWYAESTKLLEEYNGKAIPAMMTFHIPLQATIYAWQDRFAEGADCTGENRDGISAHSTEPPLWDKIKELGDVKVIVNSHDHLNDFAVTDPESGVRFAYTASMGTLEYYDPEMLGGRVVSFTPEGTTTEMSYVQEREELTPYTPIFDLNIDANNNVTNAIPCRPDLTESTNTGSIKKVDESLGTKVLSFSREEGYNNDAISAYQFSTVYRQYRNQKLYVNAEKPEDGKDLKYLTKIFADGFSMEVVFKVQSLNFNQDYVGIVDYENGGGFGLNIKKGTNGKAILLAEIGYKASPKNLYTSVSKEIDVGCWYHCVFNYDGTTLTLYLNGIEATQPATVGATYAEPYFPNYEHYICIGGCAQDGHPSGFNSFIGDIAEVKILPEEVTEDQVKAMADDYGLNASTAPILDLVIGNDDTVKNGNILGTPLTDTNYKGSIKEVVTSAELAQKVLSFSRDTNYRTDIASTYNMAASCYNSLFIDGFTLETVFKVDSSLPAGTVGIVDYVERGGWGLIVTKASTTGKATLEVEFAHGPWESREWVEPTYEIDMDTWYHFVMVYDGNGNLTIYLNGVKNDAMSKTGLKSWCPPSFEKREGEEYICIGGCSAAWSNVDPAVEGHERSTGISAFMGQIAKVTILPDAVSANDVAEMYQKAPKPNNN